MTSSLRPSEFSKEGGVTTPVAPGKVTRLTGPPVSGVSRVPSLGRTAPRAAELRDTRPALATRLSAEAECRASWYHLCRPPRRPGPTAAALAPPHGARPPCAAAPQGPPPSWTPVHFSPWPAHRQVPRGPPASSPSSSASRPCVRPSTDSQRPPSQTAPQLPHCRLRGSPRNLPLPQDNVPLPWTEPRVLTTT